MASQNKLDRIKGIIRVLMAPRGERKVSGTEMPEKMMGARKEKLDAMGGQNMGGMFDIIYKKRKEREKTIREID